MKIFDIDTPISLSNSINFDSTYRVNVQPVSKQDVLDAKPEFIASVDPDLKIKLEEELGVKLKSDGNLLRDDTIYLVSLKEDAFKFMKVTIEKAKSPVTFG